MKSLSIALLAFGGLIAAPLGAQTPPPSPPAGNPANKAPNAAPTDANFMKALSMGGMAEVEAGKLANQKASHGEVKEFAQRMVDDHSKSNDKLKALAKDRQVDLPSKLDDEQAAEKAKLESMSGAAFDTAYMDGQVRAHQKAVQLLTHEIGSGQDAKTKAFAEETLPVVQHHLEMAKELQTKTAAKRPANPR